MWPVCSVSSPSALARVDTVSAIKLTLGLDHLCWVERQLLAHRS